MKIPFLPLHIVTTKTLKLRRDAAYNLGKLYSEKEIAALLYEKAQGKIRIKRKRRTSSRLNTFR